MNKPARLKYLLQIGLAITLLYAGIAALITPNDWIGFVPGWIKNFGLSAPIFLQLHSIAEIALGAWLLTNWHLRIVVLLVFIDLAAIILTQGFGRAALSITFRDFGLLFIAFYLILAD